MTADESLIAAGSWYRTLQSIVLRPGVLTDDDAVGKVSLGEKKARGSICHGDVAAVAAELLESEAKGYLNLLEGNETTLDAVQRVVKDRIDCLAGENLYDMIKDNS
ncbi:MAG: hypothetical protein Q9206_005070 [Seirophora lacunosa]